MIAGQPVADAGSELRLLTESDADIGISNAADVDRYLSEHTELRSVVPQVCQRVRDEFGQDAELSLELYRDPEIDDQYLTLEVRQERYDSNIIERLDQISGEFADELEPCSGQILLTTDFGPSRMNDAI